MDNILRNPRTTLSGLAGAVGAALVAWSHGQLDAASIGAVIVSASMLAQGAFAKDAATHSTTLEVQQATREVHTS